MRWSWVILIYPIRTLVGLRNCFMGVCFSYQLILSLELKRRFLTTQLLTWATLPCVLLWLKLDNLFEVEKVYLDEKLTLYKLAKKIQTTDKKLSFLLNKSMNTTFYDYVNSFRVEAVKLKLVSEKSKKFTILAIAHECGFNSKASFNRIFKKSTGQNSKN